MTTNDLVDIGKKLVVPKYVLNHSKPVTAKGNFTSVEDTSAGCLLDTGIVKRKFELWDSVVRDNLLNYADPIIRARAVSLLKDKTILAYSQLRFDGKPVRMYYMQDAILSDDYDRILFCGCNQFVGKSMTMNLDAATEFLIDHGKNWVGILVSGSLPQSQYQMSRIKMLLRGGDIVYREENTVDTKTGKTDNSTQLSYTFYSDDGKTPLYRNLLICCPHTSSALGYPADVMLLDEFDFWDNCDQHRFMYQVIIPRTFQTKGKIKIYTNPDGTEKMMHQLWNQKDKDGNPVWHRYHFNCWDKDGFTQVDFDRASQGMTRERIESTLLGLFTSSRGAFFTNDEIARSLDPDLTTDRMVGKQPFFFLDVGSKHDQSVLVGGFVEPDEERKDTEGRPLLHVYVPIIHAYPVGYPLARAVGIPDVPDTDGWHYEKSVKDYMDEWTVNGVFPVLGLDVTGNSGISPLLNTVNLYPIDVTFSGPVKSGMYQRFKYLMEKGRIHRIRSAEFEYQAQHLKMKKSMRGYLMIHHETEDDLDDVMDSCAGLISLTDNPDNVECSMAVI